MPQTFTMMMAIISQYKIGETRIKGEFIGLDNSSKVQELKKPKWRKRRGC